ncbi:MAG TPA: mechanosensitive ion channel domain-containing protein [Terriglobales bacterium]|nr:mechanosensitive ion channel domain-containing protein [Terriglobales bacterium]
MAGFFADWKSWVWAAGLIGGAILLSLAVHAIIFVLAKRFARRTSTVIDDFLIRSAEAPARLILPVLAVLSVLPFVPLPQAIIAPATHFVGLLLTASIAWLVIACIDFARDLIDARHTVQVADNLVARRIQTQVQVLRHIAVSTVVVIALAVMLMTFPSIRHVGESLFASAGLAALVAGLAARSTFSNVIAGIQIALTQPIRLEDVVIVEGEWGWIEEIRSTYVVVRIWDLRRLVVPISYFIEKPFQNWTRQSADLLGTVLLYTDYTVPVEEVRQELHRILESSKMWDRKAWGLQVTNASASTLELRALMSASNSSAIWDLRCLVREKLIEFLQNKYPESLPKTRAEIAGLPAVLENKTVESTDGRGSAAAERA